MMTVLLLEYRRPSLSFLLAKTTFGHFSFSKYKLGVKSSKPELKLMQDVLICRRQKGGMVFRCWVCPRSYERISLQIMHIVINLDFLEEPSKNPTTDLIRVQTDGKASIRESLQRVSHECSLIKGESYFYSSKWLTRLREAPLSLSPLCVTRKKMWVAGKFLFTSLLDIFSSRL